MINLCHCAERSKALTYVFLQPAFQQTAITNGGLGQLEKERISQFESVINWVSGEIGGCPWWRGEEGGASKQVGRGSVHALICDDGVWSLGLLQDEGHLRPV